MRYFKSKPYLIFIIIFLLLFSSTPKNLLFYDAPEYLEIILNNSFNKSLSLGHPPIHPVFIGIFWIIGNLLTFLFKVTLEYSGNLTAMVCGIISIIIFYKIAILIVKKDKAISTTIIFTLLPAVWIINTNLMVESIALMLYLLVIYCLLNYLQKNLRIFGFFYILSSALLIGAHLEAILWLLALFSFPFLIRIKIFSARSEVIKKLFILTIIGIALGIFLYTLIFLCSGKNILSELELSFFGRIKDHYDLTKSGIIRMGRNIIISQFRAFGSLSILMVLFTLFFKRKDNNYLIGFFILTVVFCISGAVWTGDFMVRRIIFASIFIPVLISYYPKQISTTIIYYLVIIIFFNILLYSPFFNRTSAPLKLLQKTQEKIGIGKILIYTQYDSPFIHNYNGQIKLIENQMNDLSSYLDHGQEIFLDSQAVFAPYLLYTGNNLHITSLGKFGVSDSQNLFTRYSFNLASVENVKKRIYLYSLTNSDETFEKRLDINRKVVDRNTRVFIGKGKTGTPVFIYSKNFFDRILRERIDYGDLLTWIWVILSDKHEPLSWTYADKNGIFVLPVPASEVNMIDIEGENLTNIHLL